MNRRPPIGVFDSGVGGLTVLRALRSAFPAEDFIYLGDTARLPYGTKSAATVIRYSLQCADALMVYGIRCLVIACNTASASALAALRSRYPHIVIVGVIESGAAAAVAASVSQHIAVIATEGTVGGGAYQNAIRRLNPSARVTVRACSLFVSLAEEGWADGPIVEAVAHRYLDPMFVGNHGELDGGLGLESACGTVDGPDTLVLGCTHFPVLMPALRAVLPRHVRIVDSSATTTAVARALGETARVLASDAPSGGVRWLATDDAERFARVSSTFLGEPLRADQIEVIDL